MKLLFMKLLVNISSSYKSWQECIYLVMVSIALEEIDQTNSGTAYLSLVRICIMSYYSENSIQQ